MKVFKQIALGVNAAMSFSLALGYIRKYFYTVNDAQLYSEVTTWLLNNWGGTAAMYLVLILTTYNIYNAVKDMDMD